MTYRPLRLLALSLIVALGLVAAPAHRPAHAAVRRAAITVVDDRGTTVALPARPRRIISLAPNVTEILFSLDLGSEVVGVSSFSDYPAAAKRLPIVINYTSVNIEKILALKPDLLVAAAIVPASAIAKLRALHLPVLVTDPTDLPGILKDIRLVGTATGVSVAATVEVSVLQRRIDGVKALVSHTAARPRVFYELDPKQLYTGGHGSFIDSLITLAGGVNVAGTINNPYPALSAEKLIASDPQYIILGDYNYGVTAASVAARPGFGSISAVKQRHVYGINDDLVSRPGPRIVDGLDKIAELIHPGLVIH